MFKFADMIKPLFFVLTAILLFACGSLEEEQDKHLTLDQLVQKYPDSIPLLQKRANRSLDSLDYKLLLTDAAHAFRLYSSSNENRLLYALALINKKDFLVSDFTSAQYHFGKVLKKDPKNLKAIVGMASVFSFRGDLENAFTLINKALRINPRYRDAYILKGSIYLSQGYHKFYARFEEQGGGDSTTVSWSTDGGSTYVVIPSNVLYHDPNDIIRSDGSANAYFLADVVAYSTSDIRLKENITPLSTPLEKVMKLQGVDFTWKPDIDSEYAGKKDIGLIAQQVEEVLPDAVETRYNGYKAVRYEKVIPLLVEAVKEQQKQIDELKYLLQTQNK